MQRVEKHKHFLIGLSKANEKRQLSLIKKATGDQLKVIVELLMNSGKFSSTCRSERSCLQKYKGKIHRLVLKAKSLSLRQLKNEIIKELGIIVRIIGFTLHKILETALSLLFEEGGAEGPDFEIDDTSFQEPNEDEDDEVDGDE